MKRVQEQFEMVRQCRAAIDAGITRLINLGVWPRPRRSRIIRLGHDLYFADLENIEEVENYIQQLQVDNELRRIYSKDGKVLEAWTLFHSWILLLMRMLGETDGTSPSARVFNRWYSRFSKELYTPTAIWRTVDTICGCKVDGKELRLDDCSSLMNIPRRGTPEYRRLWGPKLYPLEGQLEPEGWSSTGSDKALVVTTISVPKVNHAGVVGRYSHAMNDINRSHALESALRLAKRGSPHLHAHARFQLSLFPLDDGYSSTRDFSGLGLYEEETQINRGDFPLVRNLWRELMRTTTEKSSTRSKQTKSLDLAIYEFSRSYAMSHGWIDAMFDLTIALESMFSPSDTQELKHRISLRAAWLLAQPREKEASTYKQIRTMYDIRSSRAHGNEPSKSETKTWLRILSGREYDNKNNSKQSAEAIELARNIVRRALRACMRLQGLPESGPHWPLPEDFDQNLLIAGQRAIWQRAAGVGGPSSVVAKHNQGKDKV